MIRQIILFVFLLLPSPITAAHSRRRPVIRRVENGGAAKYDRAISTFSPDGRLAQVEYGMEAANRGEGTVAAIVNDTMAFIVRSGRKGNGAGASISSGMHRIDDHIVMVTSGLEGDGRALAAAIRTSCQQHRMSFGEAPTIKEVADMTANIQHDLTKTSGARPLGCTAIIVGVSVSESGGNTMQLYQTDPGGILEQCSHCMTGKRKERVMKGLKDMQGESLKIISTALALLKDDDDAFVADLWMLCVNEVGGMRFVCAKDINNEKIATRLSVLRLA